MLGEMVIGAFKHAGRRRMAFRVGTKMAKFHRSVRESALLLHLRLGFFKFTNYIHTMLLVTRCHKKKKL